MYKFSEWSLVPGDLSALVPGPNRILADGPWSLGPYGEMSLVPGTIRLNVPGPGNPMQSLTSDYRCLKIRENALFIPRKSTSQVKVLFRPCSLNDFTNKVWYDITIVQSNANGLPRCSKERVSTILTFFHLMCYHACLPWK